MDQTKITLRAGQTVRDTNTGAWVTVTRGGDVQWHATVAVKPKYKSLAYPVPVRELDLTARDPHDAFSRGKIGLWLVYGTIMVLTTWRTSQYLDAHHVGWLQASGLIVASWFALGSALSQAIGLARR